MTTTVKTMMMRTRTKRMIKTPTKKTFLTLRTHLACRFTQQRKQHQKPPIGQEATITSIPGELNQPLLPCITIK